uniref:Reverse transcriptase Ty1/copia-type domain-containing protein n=1 Tax=Lactuca sativa TaxID=4236 RepID=A0A9R1V3A5_LACSA|nr:hypothetical protein LSAT_V11C700358880 [Lactuca sativa]
MFFFMVILMRLSTYVGLIVSLIHRNRVMFACFISPCTALNRHHTLGSIDYQVLLIPSHTNLYVVYVDHIILTRNNPEAIDRIIRSLSQTFSLQYMVHYHT